MTSRLATTLATAATTIALLLATGGCMGNSDNTTEQPPEREFDQSEAWTRLEAAAAEAIEGLPEFPGFEVRTLMIMGCGERDQYEEQWTSLELSYQFSEDISADPLVRETYLELLRDKWTEAGYEIHRDSQTDGEPPHYALEARRPDGINYWYWAAGYSGLSIQSGCVKSVENWEPECPEPLGGVTAENDRAAMKHCTPEESPTEETDALAPFEGTPAAIAPFSANGNHREAFGSSSPV